MEKIALLGPTYPYRGGISSHTTYLCEALRKKREVYFLSYETQYPTWLFPGKSDKDPSEERIQTKDVEYILDPMNPISWYKTAKSILEKGVQRLILPWWVCFWAPCYNLVIALLKRWNPGLMVTFVCHNVVEHEDHFLKRVLTKWVLSYGDSFVVQSSQDYLRLRCLLGDGIHVQRAVHPIYEEFAASHDRIKKLGKNRKRRILFFGFIRPYKGLDVLFEAFAMMQEKNSILQVVGECWDGIDKYESQADELGISERVEWVDRYVPNEELGEYFEETDVVVLPYRSASGSGICQMALSFAQPVVASRVGSISDVIEDGVNGLLVEPENPRALGQALDESLNEEINSRLRQGVLNTRSRYTWSAFAEKVLNISAKSGEGSSLVPELESI